MGHPVIIGTLMDTMNARQGQTLTREQIAGLTGLSVGQVSTGMRSLVERTNGRIEVVLRARSWRMLPDALAQKAAPTALSAPQKAAPAPKAVPVAEKPVETPQKAKNDLLLLEMLGTTTDGSAIGRDETGQMYGVRKL